MFRCPFEERKNVMRKQTTKRLSLNRDTIRQMVPAELEQILGGGISCGAQTACDCSSTGQTTGTEFCTKIQY